jgi:hypothetical protein
MCCGVSGDALMVRVGGEAYWNALVQQHVRAPEFGGRVATARAGFMLVDRAGVDPAVELASWAQKADDFIATLPVKSVEAAKNRRA